MRSVLLSLLFLFSATYAESQNTQVWKNKQCAVVLTYDDALNVHLDNVIPLLDSLKMKGTFYVTGSSEVLQKRMDEWRMAAKNSHELGNHTLFHPCNGKGRSFVNPDTDLSKYSLSRSANEIIAANTLLKAIDGKEKRSFAYPCGDLAVGDSAFISNLGNLFTGSRGVGAGMKTIDKVNLINIDCYMINMQSADYMINLVKQAEKSNTLLVFLFHGVGGEHNINVDLKEHSKLLHYLKQNEKSIWIAPMTEVAEYIKIYQQKSTGAGKI